MPRAGGSRAAPGGSRGSRSWRASAALRASQLDRHCRLGLPGQSRDVIETIATDADQIEVVRHVLNTLDG